LGVVPLTTTKKHIKNQLLILKNERREIKMRGL